MCAAFALSQDGLLALLYGNGAIESANAAIHVVVSAPVLIGIITVEAATLLVSTAVPAIRASKATAIDALRQPRDPQGALANHRLYAAITCPLRRRGILRDAGMKVDAGNGVNFFRMRIIPILAIALLAGACSRKTPAPAVVRPVKVATAAGAGLIDKDFAGMATPDDAVNLAFKVAGQVLDVPVSQGAGVKKGELLAELDPRDIELQVAATRSAFEETRSQQQRMQRLLEHEAVSRQEAEAAATRYAQARSTYENTLDLLKDTRLKAPFAGVVERKYVDNFERVQAGQPILRLVNPVTSTVQFTLPENALPLLRDSSTRFTVAFDNYRGAAIPARLKEYVETSSDASGFPVSLTLENPDPARYRISPGMSCTITMLSADPVPDAVSLPVSAVCAPAGGGTYVWIVGAGDRVMRREVTLGELFGRDRVVVDSGVAPGERVVTAGVYQLREGERVRILN